MTHTDIWPSCRFYLAVILHWWPCKQPVNRFESSMGLIAAEPCRLVGVRGRPACFRIQLPRTVLNIVRRSACTFSASRGKAWFARRRVRFGEEHYGLWVQQRQYFWVFRFCPLRAPYKTTYPPRSKATPRAPQSESRRVRRFFTIVASPVTTRQQATLLPSGRRIYTESLEKNRRSRPWKRQRSSRRGKQHAGMGGRADEEGTDRGHT